MDVQVPHSVHSEIQNKGHIQSVSSRLARNNPNSVQVQESRDTGRTYDARPCAPTIKYTTKNERVKFYGIFKREKCINDVR